MDPILILSNSLPKSGNFHTFPGHGFPEFGQPEGLKTLNRFALSVNQMRPSGAGCTSPASPEVAIMYTLNSFTNGLTTTAEPKYFSVMYILPSVPVFISENCKYPELPV